jgi:hypothetical protein
MEATDNTPPAEVSRVAVRLPPFWTEQPAVWFAQAEAQFFFAGINCERTKFCYVISQLDHHSASKVEDIITSPPDREPYTRLRTELVSRLSPSREHRIRQFLTLEMGDRKPSQFLRQLRSLVPDVPDDFLRTTWSSRLPPNIQAILAFHPEGSLEHVARCADLSTEVAPQAATALVIPPPKGTVLLQGIEDPSRQVASLTPEQNRPRTSCKNPLLSSRDPSPSSSKPHPISRNRRTGSRPPSRSNIEPNPCWYHRRYGARAQKCSKPCAYPQQKQPTQQTLPTAQVCTTSTGRLFITDRSTKRQYLVDTGSDLCVYPRRLVPRRMERVDYDLCAANGSTIHTYG